MAKFNHHRHAMSVIADIQDRLSDLDAHHAKVSEKIDRLLIVRQTIETERAELSAGAMALGVRAGFIKAAAE